MAGSLEKLQKCKKYIKNCKNKQKCESSKEEGETEKRSQTRRE